MPTLHLNTAWRSPSNIAIIKYWGKHGDQLPDNPSLSLTLTEALTETRISAQTKQGEKPVIEFRFEGASAPAFGERISRYLQKVTPRLPVLAGMDLVIDSSNSFPHSAGIASSASAMCALACCLVELQQQYEGVVFSDLRWERLVSEIARLGSGSACRSVEGPVMVWGSNRILPGASDTFAIKLEEVHPVFTTMRDSILIIDDGVKHVSSSAGHALMISHPYRNARLDQASAHLSRLVPAMQHGDLVTFGEIAEAEALALHALMMTSSPSFMLFHPETIEVLNRVREFRASSGAQVYFTLDAGPNVHLLYPESETDLVLPWITETLTQFCTDSRVIHDYVGTGVELM